MDLFEKIKTKYYLILLLLISVISHWYIFLDFKLLNSGDWVYESPALLKNFFRIGLWNEYVGLGKTNGFPSNLIFYWGSSFFYNIGFFNWDVYTRIFFLTPIVILTPITSFLLFKKITKNNLSAFASASAYCFNTFFLKLQLDWITYAWIWWLFPALVLSLWNYLQGKGDKNLIYIILLIFLGITFEIRITLILLVFMSFAVFLHIYINRKDFITYMRSYIMIGIAFLFGVFTHLFWIIPTTRGLSRDVLSQASTTPFVSYFDLKDVLTLHSYQWRGNYVYEAFIKQTVPLRLYIVSVVAFIGIFEIRNTNNSKLKHRKYWFLLFAISLVVSSFISKQEFQPFSAFYRWAFLHVPLFNLYRESSKFLIIVALSLSFYFGVGVEFICKNFSKINKITGIIFVLLVISFALFYNLQHYVDQDIGAMTKGIEMPIEYKSLENTLSTDNEFYRTLWVPQRPRFGFQSNNHPAIDMTDLVKTLQNRLEFTPFNQQMSSSEQLTYLLKQPYAIELLKSMSVRYVIIPSDSIRSRRTNTDTAEKISDIFEHYGDRETFVSAIDETDIFSTSSLKIKGLSIYENRDYKNYITDFTQLTNFASLVDLNNKLDFAVSIDAGVNFTDTSTDGATDIVSALDSLTAKSVLKNSLRNETLNQYKLNAIYKDQVTSQLSYSIANNVLSLYSTSYFNVIKVEIAHVSLETGRDYYFAYNNVVHNIDLNDKLERKLGKIEKNVKLLSTDKISILANDQLFVKAQLGNVIDCNAYDSKPDISTGLKFIGGVKLVDLNAGHHTACLSSQFIDVKQNTEYLLSFQYTASDFNGSSYSMEFNDPAHTIIRKTLSRKDDKLSNLIETLLTPTGATKMQLIFYTSDRPSMLGEQGQRVRVSTKFSNPKLEAIVNNLEYEPPPKNYEKTVLTTNISNTTFDNFEYKNLIDNPSLEKGLWQSRVSDCHNYDDNPQISMYSSSDATDGSKSLKLQAARHIACTSTKPTVVDESTNYLFSFDYKTPNAQVAKYYISFDDDARTVITDTLSLNDKLWHTFTKQIKTPFGATKMNLTLYAQSESPEGTTITNLYDNFSLIKLPDIGNAYYAVGTSSTSFNRPKKITYSLVTPTTKSVKVKGATTAFYLGMSEAYHDQWKLEFDNSKLSDFGSWFPTAHADVIPDSNHFKLDDFLNGWYVDVPKYCGQQHLCTQNKDGSYDIEFVAEFTPQRWFYVGLIISGTTLLGCFVFLAYDYKKRHGKHIYYAIPGLHSVATGLKTYNKHNYKMEAISREIKKPERRR